MMVRMELLLNLAWALLATLMFWLWLCHAPCQGIRRTQLVALAVVIVILFPVSAARCGWPTSPAPPTCWRVLRTTSPRPRRYSRPRRCWAAGSTRSKSNWRRAVISACSWATRRCAPRGPRSVGGSRRRAQARKPAIKSAKSRSAGTRRWRECHNVAPDCMSGLAGARKSQQNASSAEQLRRQWRRVTGDAPPMKPFRPLKDAMSETTSQPSLLRLTSQIVAAHAAHNQVTSDALLRLIENVYTTLAAIGSGTPAPEKPQPAVPVKRSVFPDHIVCLEDGKKLKMLKRHLMTTYQLTPEQVPGRNGACRRTIRWWRRTTRHAARRWRKASGSAASRQWPRRRPPRSPRRNRSRWPPPNPPPARAGAGRRSPPAPARSRRGSARPPRPSRARPSCSRSPRARPRARGRRRRRRPGPARHPGSRQRTRRARLRGHRVPSR